MGGSHPVGGLERDSLKIENVIVVARKDGDCFWHVRWSSRGVRNNLLTN